jgi:hypothetical protein
MSLCGRLLTVVALFATTFPAPPAGAVLDERPARTLSIPRTLARTARLEPTGGLVDLALPATHIAFSWTGDEGTGVRYRTVSDSGRRSPWRRAPEAHDMEAGQRHFSGVIVVGRPASIDWRPVRPKDAQMGRVTLDQLNTVDGARTTAAAPQEAGAPAGAPNIVTRAEWGANESVKRTGGSCRRRFYNVQQLFVHHTAGSNFDDNPKATMRAIYWYHTVRRGWCDLGYNFVIGQNGKIYEGRWARKYRPWETHNSEDSKGRAVSGAHVANFNSGSVGVSLMGNFDNAPIPPVMRRSLARLLAWEADRHNLPPRGRHTYRNPETGLTRRLPYIAGHRDAGSTACPGRRVYAALPKIRRDVKAVMGAGKRTSSLELPKSPVSVAYGEDLVLAGTLLTGSVTALAGRTVKLWNRDGSEGWDVMATTETTADGSFTFVVSPQRRRKVVAVFDGDAQTWGSQSNQLTIMVRRLVTLTLPGVTPDATGVHHLPAGTTSVTFTGAVTPNRGAGNVAVKVSKQQPDGSFLQVARWEVDAASDGTFDYTFTVPDPAAGGVYRAVASTPSTDRLARGSSARITFDIPAG